jgi:phosphate transport system substrate-binding protein
MRKRTFYCLLVCLVLVQADFGLAAEPSVNPPAADPYCPKEEVSGQLRLVGSATMQQLAALWSDGFRRLHPQVEIGIDCRGSETALPALAKDQSVLGLMSRHLTGDEQRKMEQELACRVVSLAVCVDLLAVIVHGSNPIPGLSWDRDSGQLRVATEVAKARIWGDLGLGDDWATVPVSWHTLGTDSGTRWHFDRLLPSLDQGSPAVREHATQAELVKAVAADRGALALVSLLRGDLPDVRLLPLSADGRNFVAATADEAAARRYPLLRPLHLVVAFSGESLERPVAEEFVAYVLSRSGQQDVAKDGFLPLDRSELHAQREKLGWKQVE